MDQLKLNSKYIDVTIRILSNLYIYIASLMVMQVGFVLSTPIGTRLLYCDNFDKNRL